MFFETTLPENAGYEEWLDAVATNLIAAGWETVLYSKKNCTYQDQANLSQVRSLTNGGNMYSLTWETAQPITIEKIHRFSGSSDLQYHNGSRWVNFPANPVGETTVSITAQRFRTTSSNNKQFLLANASGYPVFFAHGVLVMRTTTRSGLPLIVCFEKSLEGGENVRIRLYSELDVTKGIANASDLLQDEYLALSGRCNKLWMHANEDAIFVLTKHSNIYSPMFAGLLNSYSADYDNFPLFVRGTQIYEQRSYTDDSEHHHFINTVSGTGSGSFLINNQQERTTPSTSSTSGYVLNTHANIPWASVHGNKAYTTEIEFSFRGVMQGFLPWVKKCVYNNPIPEDKFSVNGKQYMTFPDIFRTSSSKYYALEIE